MLNWHSWNKQNEFLWKFKKKRLSINFIVILSLLQLTVCEQRCAIDVIQSTWETIDPALVCAVQEKWLDKMKQKNLKISSHHFHPINRKSSQSKSQSNFAIKFFFLLSKKKSRDQHKLMQFSTQKRIRAVR